MFTGAAQNVLDWIEINTPGICSRETVKRACTPDYWPVPLVFQLAAEATTMHKEGLL